MNLDPLVCEVIAKRWCRLMGLNPYELVTHEDRPHPQWYVVAEQVPAQVAWYRAISGQEE